MRLAITTAITFPHIFSSALAFCNYWKWSEGGETFCPSYWLRTPREYGKLQAGGETGRALEEPTPDAT